MPEEKKDECCSTKKGCGCCCGAKLLAVLVVGAFIFAAGMWFARAHCQSYHGFCPLSAPAAK